MTRRGAASAYYFPPGESVARRVHEERVVGVLYGQRAVLIGALEPRTYTGTMLSTRSRDRPFLRLARTAKIQETVLLGTREEADRALASVHRLHSRVKGRLPNDVGRVAAGTRYSAFDPELMLWTLAVIADSARAIYETLVQALSEVEREQLWADYLLFGQLFGIPREMMPATASEFGDWFEGKMRSADLRATAHALEVAPIMAFAHPVPAAMRPGLHANNLMIKGTLPARVREIFEISWGPGREAGFRALTSGHRRARHLLPSRVRHGRNGFFFDLVARAEGRRGGTKVPDLASAQNS
jgi:uncharacterized protein (DUF2236 family)